MYRPSSLYFGFKTQNFIHTHDFDAFNKYSLFIF